MLTRGATGRRPRTRSLDGVHVHRVPETSHAARPRRVRHLDRADERRHARRRASSSAERRLRPRPRPRLARRRRRPTTSPSRRRCPFVTTIHATEYGRHQGWVDKHPQSHIHGVERWMAHRADHVITCSHYMRGHVADIYDLDEERISVIPNGIDPERPRSRSRTSTRLRARFAAPDEKLVLLVGRLVYEKGFQLALDALPGPDPSRLGQRALPRRRLGHPRGRAQGAGRSALGHRGARHVPGLDRRRRPALALPDRRPHAWCPRIYEPFGLVALEAMASGCPCIVADTGGLREVVPDRERRPALQRRRRRARSAS